MNSRVSGAILLCFAPFGALPIQEAALTIKPESVSAMGLTGRFVRTGCVAIALSTLLGCERVVDLHLPDGGGQLAIEAPLERVQGALSGKQRFVLTTFQGFGEPGPPPPAHGAAVAVSDDLGRTRVFVESRTEPGVFETESLTGESAAAMRSLSPTRASDTPRRQRRSRLPPWTRFA
jgi:hypothetical protein